MKGLSPFDAFNVLRSPQDIATDLYAALRAWETPYVEHVNICRSLHALAVRTTDEAWRDINPLVGLCASRGVHPKALEIFQILKIWDLSARQMRTFCEAMRDKSAGTTRSAWEAWSPEIAKNEVFGGIRPN